MEEKWRPDWERLWSELPLWAAIGDRSKGAWVWISPPLLDYLGVSLAEVNARGWAHFLEEPLTQQWGAAGEASGDGTQASRQWSALNLARAETNESSGEAAGKLIRLLGTGGRRELMTMTVQHFAHDPWTLAVWQVASGVWSEVDELRQSDRRLRALLDNTTAVVFVKDLSGRFIYVNRRFEELFGYSQAEALNHTVGDLFPARHATTYDQNDQRVLRSKGSLEFEEQATQADGLHTYLSLKFALRDAQGQPYAICGISTDITARKRMEATLRESEQRFRQMAENLNECIWVREVSTWRLLYVNPAYERIWGQPLENLYVEPDTWLAHTHPADRERVRKAFYQRAVQGTYNEQYRIVRPDGEVRWIADRGVAIRNEAGEVYRIAGIAEDISERRMLENEVAEASCYEQERISRELHDGLGQQLTGLGYLATSLARRLQGPDAESASLIRDGLKEALGEVRRVVRGLAPVELDEAGLQVALEQLANSVYNRYQVPCRFHHGDEVLVDDHTVATQLYRIAQEAVNNAIRHGQPSVVEIRLEASGDQLCLTVRDNGRGLPPGGTRGGLGLRIMRYRSSIIGANFEVSSMPQLGTTISIRLQKVPSREIEAGKDLPNHAR